MVIKSDVSRVKFSLSFSYPKPAQIDRIAILSLTSRLKARTAYVCSEYMSREPLLGTEAGSPSLVDISPTTED